METYDANYVGGDLNEQRALLDARLGAGRSGTVADARHEVFREEVLVRNAALDLSAAAVREQRVGRRDPPTIAVVVIRTRRSMWR